MFFGCFTGSVSHAVASNIDCCCGVVIILVRLLLLLLLLCTRTRYMVLEGNISICGGGSSKGNVVVILKIVEQQVLAVAGLVTFCRVHTGIGGQSSI